MKQTVLAAMILIWGAASVQAQDADIRAVISGQIDAFEVDDFATAFTFASPSLQGLFQTPPNFGQMISQGYSMVQRPSAVDYLELREEDGTYRQKVQITDTKGKFHYLEYEMLETPNGWRINGVQILDAPGAAV